MTAKMLAGSCLAALAAVGLAGTAWARLEPTFDLAYSNGKATHVVVVDQTGVVVESWRGDLKTGAKLPFPVGKGPVAIASPAAPESSRREGATISGKRRVLFLIRVQPPADKDVESWVPAASPKATIELATVFVEQGQCYALQQIMNPGPVRVLALYGIDEKKLKERVAAGEK